MLRRPWVLPVFGILFAAPAPVAHATAVPALRHVVVVVMENKNYEQVRWAPAIADLASRGATFSDFHAITHPSQPNYLALWSGGTQGVSSNGCPVRGAPLMAENLGHAADAAGLSWRAYSENLPEPGSPECTAERGLYTRKHEPWTQFGNLDHRNERPYSDLGADIAAGRLPNLAFVIPNNVDNMHDGSIAAGDAWLGKNLPPLLEAVGPRGIVVLTWDESAHGPANHILTVIAGGPVKRGFLSSRTATHYTLLRTVCDALQLPAPGAAAAESPIVDIWQEATPVAATSAGSGTGAPPPQH